MKFGFGRTAIALATIGCCFGSFTVQSRADPLCDELGGRDGISRFVAGTVDRAVKDERIKAEFEDVNLDRLKRMVTDYVCQAAGGPCTYKGSDMRIVHRGVHASESDFNAFVEDLQDSMDASGIPFRTQNRLLAILAPVEHDVVTH
jgi:hemoglobin